MPDYLVETYAPVHAQPDVVAHTMFAPGVRHLRSIFVPEDEAALHLFAAPSVAALREALASAAVAYDRIVETSAGGSRAARRQRERN